MIKYYESKYLVPNKDFTSLKNYLKITFTKQMTLKKQL